MVRYTRKVLKIREQLSFGPKFPVEFVPVFQKDLGWPTEHSLVHKTDCLLSENKLAAFSTMSLQFLPLSPSPGLLFLFLENSVCTYMPYTMTDPAVAYIFPLVLSVEPQKIGQ